MKFLDPQVIPYYGCVDIRFRGGRCKGNATIDAKKYCLQCNNYDPINSVLA